MKLKNIMISTFIAGSVFTTGAFATETVSTPAPAAAETTTATTATTTPEITAPAATEPTTAPGPTVPVAPVLTDAQVKEAAILELTNAIALLETKTVELKAKLMNATVTMTAEEKTAIEAQLATIQKDLDLNYSKLASLQVPTVDEKLVLESKAMELKLKIAELEKKLKSGAAVLSKAEIEKLKTELSALKTELDQVKSALGIEDPKNPNQSRFDMAKKLGITPGKMRLLEKLMTMLGIEIDMKEWAAKPVKAINLEVKDERKNQKNVNKVNPKELMETKEGKEVKEIKEIKEIKASKESSNGEKPFKEHKEGKSEEGPKGKKK